MKVLFGTKFSSKLLEFYKTRLSQEIELIIPNNFDQETILDLAPLADIYVDYQISKEFLNRAKNLKHIQIPWTGSEKLDFDLLKQYPNITVSNSHSNSLTIAEHAVALLLATAKQVLYRDKYMREGDWTPRYDRGNYSLSLTGKTASILGYGAIGQKVARMLKNAFDMRILAVKHNTIDVQPDGVFDYLGNLQNLENILEQSDFIIVSLPLTKKTKGIINQEQFSKMKENAVIVNIARGPIIDEKALYENLKAKRILAGIDVWYNYPENWVDFSKASEKKRLYQNYPFEELDNIILSPHAAFKVEDIGQKTAEDIIENLNRISKGEKPKNLLKLDFGY